VSQLLGDGKLSVCIDKFPDHFVSGRGAAARTECAPPSPRSIGLTKLLALLPLKSALLEVAVTGVLLRSRKTTAFRSLA
jgi:hypothetical protein